jgi:GNAT superfamily N-acetyltransferase
VSVHVMIRTIGTAEWPTWRDLRLRALKDAPDAFRSTLEEESGHPDQWWSELVLASVENPRAGLWVAWADDEAVGMLFGRVDDKYSVLEIGAMWVAPEVRRRSVGSGLIEAAIEWARGWRVSVASLWVTEDNAEAIAFYRSHGFQPTEVTDALRPGSHLTVRKLESGRY